MGFAATAIGGGFLFTFGQSGTDAGSGQQLPNGGWRIRVGDFLFRGPAQAGAAGQWRRSSSTAFFGRCFLFLLSTQHSLTILSLQAQSFQPFLISFDAF